MVHLPDPMSSDTFRIWMKEYLENFEEHMLQRIAVEQRRQAHRPRILQALADRKYVETGELEDWKLYPLIEGKHLQNKCLLFAPLPYSQIERLTHGTHSYSLEGKQFPVRLTRSHIFFERERDLCCHFGNEAVAMSAKVECLPELSFPFLPYSRKFLELELLDVSVAHANRVRTEFTPENLKLQEGIYAHELGLTNELVPVWNVLYKSPNIYNQCSAEGDSFVWRPSKKRDFEDIDLENIEAGVCIFHRAFDTANKSVDFTFSDGRIKSAVKLRTVHFSIIIQVKQIPRMLPYPVIGLQQPNPTDNYWYRNFLQSAVLTQRDLDVLLGMLPETRGQLRCIETQMINCSEDLFLDFVSERRPFFDYLWYLDSKKLTKELGADKIKLLSIMLDHQEKHEKNLEFILEDRANYFASMCKLYMPMHVECKSYLPQK